MSDKLQKLLQNSSQVSGIFDNQVESGRGQSGELQLPTSL
jgi:hypothetical protein